MARAEVASQIPSNEQENVQQVETEYTELIQQAIASYKLKQQRGLLNALFISFLVFILISVLLAFVFLLIPIPGLLIGWAVLQIFWFPLLAAILFILAQALILPNVGRFSAFVGVFIAFVVFFLVAFGLGIAAAVNLNVAIAIAFTVFQFLWHVMLFALLGLILFALPVFLSVAVGFYALLILFTLFFDLVFLLLVIGSIGLLNGIATLVLFYLIIIVSLVVVLAILIQQTNHANEKKQE